MLALTIKSRRTNDSLHVPLEQSQIVRLGRSSKTALSIPWDPAISREHADLTLVDQQLHVRCLPSARNPLLVNGESVREIELPEGSAFQIGTTEFCFVDDSVSKPSQQTSQTVYQIDGGTGLIEFEASNDSIEADVLEEHTFAPGDLTNFSFGNADERIEMLAKLPRLIANSKSDEDLALSLVGLLLKAIPKATAVAVAHFNLDELPISADADTEFPKPVMLRIETRDDFNNVFRPSRRLILRALRDQQSVMQIWNGSVNAANFTLSEGLGWAIVIPIAGQSCEGWCLYISGGGGHGITFVTQDDLVGDLRCGELIAQFIGSIRQVRLLQTQKTRMSAYFSPKIVESLTKATTTTAMTPIERDVAILFCDVRNFSKKSEQLKFELLTLLKSVSAALGAMTDGILDFDGTIADFQGDAALGFWGWPVANEDGPIPACMAAINILKRFQNPIGEERVLLDGFSIGMGIAYGRALAGEIGTHRQSKLGVFGPVVNTGSRLQGLTKQFGVSICIDEATAKHVKEDLLSGTAVTRRLGRVIPKGMIEPMNLYSLECVGSSQHEAMLESVCTTYESALQKYEDGDFAGAEKFLKMLPQSDGPTKFLLRHLHFVADKPTDRWDGTITFQTK